MSSIFGSGIQCVFVVYTEDVEAFVGPVLTSEEANFVPLRMIMVEKCAV